MLESLVFDRPIAFIDIESTGISPRADRIVELAMIRIDPNGGQQTWLKRIDPCIPIPPEVTAIHGITDADVEGCPKFFDVAADVDTFLNGCDIGGYNVGRFDIPMLTEELLRAGIHFDISTRRIIDPQTIYHRREPRDLTAALAFYCGETHANAHGAEADVLATIRVLEGQLEHYEDLPREVGDLDRLCNPRNPTWVDRTGKLKWQDGEVAINFGRKKGMLLRDLIENDPSYIKWLLRSDFPRDTITIVEKATEGSWPPKP